MRIYDGDKHDTSNTVSDHFLSVNACGISTRKESRTIRTKGRVDHLLLYVESGSLTAILFDQKQNLIAGDILYYPPGIPQDYTLHSGAYYWVHFSGTGVDLILSELSDKKGRIFRNLECATITRRYERLLYDWSPENRHTLFLASDLLRLIGSLENNAPHIMDKRIQNIVVDMHKNYTKPFDLDLYAKKAYLSKGRFIKMFKHEVGISPYAYFLSLRLSNAAELLSTSTLSISEIAKEVGFEDPLYFSRVFKKAYHDSPSVYRKKQNWD